MKINLSINEDINLEIELEKKEVEKLVDIFKKIGLRKGKVYDLWGAGIEEDAWIDTDNSLINTFWNSYYDYRLFNNLNESPLLFENGEDVKLNIAILRLFDTDRRKVKIKLDKFLTILEFKKTINLFKEAIEKIFNLIIDDISVEIKDKNK